MLCGNYILSNRSEWTFYFLSSVQFNFTIGENLFLKKKVKLDSANGDINVDYCNAKGYNLSADNGDVTFNDKNMDDSYNKNSSSQQLLSAYSDNGDVSVN